MLRIQLGDTFALWAQSCLAACKILDTALGWMLGTVEVNMSAPSRSSRGYVYAAPHPRSVLCGIILGSQVKCPFVHAALLLQAFRSQTAHVACPSTEEYHDIMPWQYWNMITTRGDG